MNVILCGYGRMGLMIEQIALQSEDMEIIGVVHPGLYDSPLDVPGHADVIIDFSYPGNLDGILARARRDCSAVVIGTTGFTEEQLAQIREASKTLRVMHSSNYSVGVAVLKRAVAMVAPALKDSFDIEIVETHHNQKVDAPSGTAKMLLKAVDPDDGFDHVYGREGCPGPGATRSASTRCGAAPWPGSTACSSSASTRRWSSSTAPPAAAYSPPGPCGPRASWSISPPGSTTWTTFYRKKGCSHERGGNHSLHP